MKPSKHSKQCNKSGQSKGKVTSQRANSGRHKSQPEGDNNKPDKNSAKKLQYRKHFLTKHSCSKQPLDQTTTQERARGQGPVSEGQFKQSFL